MTKKKVATVATTALPAKRKNQAVIDDAFAPVSNEQTIAPTATQGAVVKPTVAKTSAAEATTTAKKTATTAVAKTALPANTNTFLIEKHRYTKGRLNTKTEKTGEPSLCLRFGPHYIKTTFLANGHAVRPHVPTDEANLLREYERICTIYRNVDWQVNRAALEACSMSDEDMRRASDLRSGQRANDSSGRSTAMTASVAEASTAPILCGDASLREIFDAPVVQRKRKRVLVPFSGGLSSMATLWWCLLQDYDVFLCYAFGALDNCATIAEKPAEIECLLRLLQYARTIDGRLLFDKRERPESGVHELTREEIAQRIRVVQVPQSAYYLPDRLDVSQDEPFCNDQRGARLKAHPQAYLLFYRQMTIVAQSLDCTGIALGMHGDAQQLLNAAHGVFDKLHSHSLLMPFATRVEALVAFQEAAQQSWLVWKSFFLQQQQQQQQQPPQPPQQQQQSLHKDTAPQQPKQRSEQANSDDREPDCAVVWQTAGAALMPNASHYVTTCSTTSAVRAKRDAVLQSAQNAALERVQCLLEEDLIKEQARIDAAVARGEKPRKKRAPDPFQHAQYLTFFAEELSRQQSGESDGKSLFHFCNRCIDCWQWRSIVAEWHATLGASAMTAVAPQWQNLATEYVARIAASQQRNGSKEATVVCEPVPTTAIDAARTAGENAPVEPQELSLADLQPSRKRLRSGDNEDESSEDSCCEEFLFEDEKATSKAHDGEEDEREHGSEDAEERDGADEADGAGHRDDDQDGEEEVAMEEDLFDEDDDDEDNVDDDLDDDDDDDDANDDNDGDDGSDY